MPHDQLRRLNVFERRGIRAPTLTTPENADVLSDTTPEFTWSAVAGAASYDIEIAETLTGTPTETGIEALMYTPAVALDAGVTYSWRVRGINAGGAEGVWSAVRTFTLYAVYDAFTAADGTNLNGRAPDVGPAAWAVLDGGYQINTNRVLNTGIGHALIDSGLSDFELDCDVTVGNATAFNYSSLFFRAPNNANGWHIALYGLSTSRFKLIELVANVETIRVSAAPTLNPDGTYHLRLIVSGQTIRAILDNAYSLTWTAAVTNETVTKHGFRSAQGGTVTTRSRYDTYALKPLPAPLIPMSQHFAGTSFTFNDSGYRAIAIAWEPLNYPYHIVTSTLQALSGHNTWSNLVRLTTGYDLVILDHANDTDRDIDKAAVEALIRRLWTADATTRVILISSPHWAGQDTAIDSNVNHPTNEAVIGNVAALAEHYGIPFVDYWSWCKTVVNGGTYHLNELTADTVHPTALGHTNMAALLEAHLPTGGTAAPSPLPARLHDNGDYENTPTVKNGTAFDSRTGVWSDGTPANSTSSSEVGATITFSATCQSFGLFRADLAANSVQVSIDGGAYADAVPDQNGIAIAGARAAHTIAIKVKSGTVRIDQFWAI